MIVLSYFTDYSFSVIGGGIVNLLVVFVLLINIKTNPPLSWKDLGSNILSENFNLNNLTVISCGQ